MFSFTLFFFGFCFWSTIFRGDGHTKSSIFNLSAVVPDSRVQKDDVTLVDKKFKWFTNVVTFRRRSNGPRFASLELSLPHQSWNVIQLEK